MKKDDCFQIGRFIKPHGFKGELSIKLDVDHPQEYQEMESAFVEINKELIPFFFERLRLNNKGIATVKIEGIDTEEDALTLVKKNLYLPLDILPKLTGNRFYFHEIEGFKAIDNEFGEIGVIQAVLDGNAQDIFQIINGKKEILIPIVDDFILSVDRDKKEILLNAPEGLIDFYLNN